MGIRRVRIVNTLYLYLYWGIQGFSHFRQSGNLAAPGAAFFTVGEYYFHIICLVFSTRPSPGKWRATNCCLPQLHAYQIKKRVCSDRAD